MQIIDRRSTLHCEFEITANLSLFGCGVGGVKADSHRSPPFWQKMKGFQAVGSHEIANAAGVSSATLYRWWDSKEEILLHACFEPMKPVLAVSGSGSPLARLRRYVVYVGEFLASVDGVTMARLVTGIHDDKRL